MSMNVSDDEMNKLLGSGLRALILDLRENTGGLLDSAQEVADRFLESGLIVRTSGRMTDTKQRFASREGTYPAIPLVVLVNESTASAAEIVAGSLRDHERAVVIGVQTCGKGSVQEVVELIGQHGAIKLTTAYYYLKNGECIHKTPEAEKSGSWGVRPNITVSLTLEQRKKWEQSWRDITREPATDAANESLDGSTATDEVTGQSEKDGTHEKLQSDVIAQRASALMTQDVQLQAAFDYLCKLLSPKENPGRIEPASQSVNENAKS
ncbi:MAG: hypothetical protein IPK83_16005 [Planctomycetes bacterium]|nr:hypothetical protein [Planctomycetota bacterium]